MAQLGLGGLAVGGVPDPAQLLADGLSDGEVGGVMDGVLSQMVLTALPDGAAEDGLGHLEDDVATVADDLRGGDLDELFAQRGQ